MLVIGAEILDSFKNLIFDDTSLTKGLPLTYFHP